MDSVHLGQAAHAPPVYRMVPPYNFEKLHLPHLLTPVPVRLEAAAGYRLPGVRGCGHFRGSKRPQVGPVQKIVLMRLSAEGVANCQRTPGSPVGRTADLPFRGHQKSWSADSWAAPDIRPVAPPPCPRWLRPGAVTVPR